MPRISIIFENSSVCRFVTFLGITYPEEKHIAKIRHGFV